MGRVHALTKALDVKVLKVDDDNLATFSVEDVFTV